MRGVLVFIIIMIFSGCFFSTNPKTLNYDQWTHNISKDMKTGIRIFPSEDKPIQINKLQLEITRLNGHPITNCSFDWTQATDVPLSHGFYNFLFYVIYLNGKTGIYESKIMVNENQILNIYYKYPKYVTRKGIVNFKTNIYKN